MSGDQKGVLLLLLLLRCSQPRPAGPARAPRGARRMRLPRCPGSKGPPWGRAGEDTSHAAWAGRCASSPCSVKKENTTQSAAKLEKRAAAPGLSRALPRRGAPTGGAGQEPRGGRGRGGEKRASFCALRPPREPGIPCHRRAFDVSIIYPFSFSP